MPESPRSSPAPRVQQGDRGKVRPTAQRYLAVCFPWLPADRLRHTRPHLFVGDASTPVVLVAGDRHDARLEAVDGVAAAAGLAVGDTVAAARALLPELRIFTHQPAADLDWLERLAHACTRDAPTVAVSPPDTVLLDLTGRHQPEGPLAVAIEARLARRGIVVRHAFGGTPAAACALARFAGGPAPDERSALRRLPVAALGLDPDDFAALVQAGLRTVGDVAARPPKAVAAQFGPAVANAMRALDEAGAPLVPCRPPPALVVERRMAAPIVRLADLRAAAAALAGELATALTEREEAARRWTVSLFRADGVLHALRVELGEPTRDPALLCQAIHARLARGGAPLDASCGYDLLRLEVDRVVPSDAVRLRLDGDAIAPARPARRRGAGRRRGAEPGQAAPGLFAPGIPHGPEPWRDGDGSAGPIHLFDPPEQVDEVAAEPGDPPACFRWRRTLHRVARAAGPEPDITGRHEGERHYFRVENHRGRRFWLFRQDRAGEASCWFLHGLLA